MIHSAPLESLPDAGRGLGLARAASLSEFALYRRPAWAQTCWTHSDEAGPLTLSPSSSLAVLLAFICGAYTHAPLEGALQRSGVKTHGLKCSILLLSLLLDRLFVPPSHSRMHAFFWGRESPSKAPNRPRQDTELLPQLSASAFAAAVGRAHSQVPSVPGNIQAPLASSCTHSV
jgi:hypothetical protein